jgi:hypothetical protein
MEFISGVESVLTEHSCSLLLRLVRSVEEEAGLLESWSRGRHIGGAILVDLQGFGAEVARTLFGEVGSHAVATPVLTPRGSTAPPR